LLERSASSALVGSSTDVATEEETGVEEDGDTSDVSGGGGPASSLPLISLLSKLGSVVVVAVVVVGVVVFVAVVVVVVVVVVVDGVNAVVASWSDGMIVRLGGEKQEKARSLGGKSVAFTLSEKGGGGGERVLIKHD